MSKPRIKADKIPVYCRYDEIVGVEELVPNPKNPNEHPDNQVELLGKIIKHQGWRQPITVSKLSGFIVKGHGRLQASINLGLNKVPVEYQEYENEASEYADLIADNRIAELSQMNQQVVDDILKEDIFEDFDIGLTGFDAPDINVNFDEGSEDDQGKLDEIDPKIVTCPYCEQQFDVREKV
tara:strand:- start:958 stop:1500 length:543 start_codon:yes stop_codon:yes gene_type:complete